MQGFDNPRIWTFGFRSVHSSESYTTYQRAPTRPFNHRASDLQFNAQIQAWVNVTPYKLIEMCISQSSECGEIQQYPHQSKTYTHNHTSQKFGDRERGRLGCKFCHITTELARNRQTGEIQSVVMPHYVRLKTTGYKDCLIDIGYQSKRTWEIVGCQRSCSCQDENLVFHN